MHVARPAPLRTRPVEVVARLHVQLVPDDGRDDQAVKSVGLAAQGLVHLAVREAGVLCVRVADGLCERAARGVDILRAQRPVVELVFAAYGVAVLWQRTNALITRRSFEPFALAGHGTFPAEHTEPHARHGHHPQAADKVFALVYVFRVDALPVEESELIVQQMPTGRVLEEIALDLQPHVAAIAGLFAASVAEAGQFRHGLPHAHEALIDGVHGVLECERPLVLAYLDLEEIILLPFGKQIDDARTTAQGRCVSVELNLRLPIEIVQDAPIER